MAKVYFRAIDSYSSTAEISKAARELLGTLINDENIPLEPEAPLKVHFGERGNTTFIAPVNYEGVIAYLKEHKVRSCFIETNGVYSGSRMIREKHIELAKDHGFTQLPIVIADGEHGEEFTEIEISGKHFRKCRIGKEFGSRKQFIVLSHFKGHGLSGFGGAIKHLGMGFAARGGKLEQHVDAKPFIIPFKCRKCGTCVKHCPVDAITLGFIPRIDKRKCIGCASCIAVCQYKAVFINVFKAQLFNKFREKVAEYALAAQKGKRNIYITFAFNITKGCDCEGRAMKPIAPDLGVFASADPVAIDKACMDKLDEKENRQVFKGRDILEYAQSLGLGTTHYELVGK
jgi:uncharacterized Fe-S center protein